MAVRALRALPAVGMAAAALTVAAGLWLARHDGRELGVPFPPFAGRWDPTATAWALLAAALVLLTTWAGPGLLGARVRPAAFAAAAYGLTLALRLALGASSRGSAEWSRVFDPDGFEGPNEYLPALAALRYGTGFFLDAFAELVPALPVHAAGHPPGLLVVLHWLGIGTPGGLAALCLLGGALIAPLTYLTGRAVLDETGARIAALLCAASPSVLLFGATSADALYAVLGLAAAALLASRRRTSRLAGALVLAAGTLFAWSLPAVGAWATVLAWRRDGVRAALGLAIACGAALAVVLGGLAAATGFDPVGTLRATERVYRFGIAAERPYGFWVFGSPAAFGIMLGLPVTWYALRALGAGRDAALAIAAVIAVAAVAGFTKGEVERIWLFLAPLACLAAASALEARRLRPVLALLGIQALAWELAWNTVW